MVFVASSAASTGVTDAGVYLGMVLLLGLAAQWLAWRFRIPSILFLLLFGFLSGLVVRPDEIISESLLFPLVSLAVGVILFEGGLTLRFSELKGVTQPLVRLCTWGAGVTWVLASLAAYFLAGLPWLVAILFGAILVVTGPTVILPLLRFIKPNRSVGAIAKWEGIVIDPVGAVLAVLVLQMVLSDTLGKAAQSAVVVIGQTVVVGFGLAFVAAKLLELFLKRHWIPDYLHALTFLTTGTVVFVAANTLQTESGLVAVTTLGILLANQRSVSVREVLEFKEHLRVLLISVLFIVLSSRVQLGELAALGWRGPAFVAALIFLVRPLSIFLSTLGSSLGWKEKVLLCFLAPRGIVAAAVASIFALEIAHVAAKQGNEALQQAAQQLVPLTFSVIVGTVTFYGLTAGPVARRLGLASRNPQGVLFAGTPLWAIEAGKLLKEEGFQVLYVDTSRQGIARARMAGMNTCLANILSEFVGEELELAGMGKLLAVTRNDEVNSLAILEFRHLFGKEHTYQLHPQSEDEHSSHRKKATTEIRGRMLFREGADWLELDTLFRDSVLKRTKLSEEYEYQAYQERYHGKAIPLFFIKGEQLQVATEESSEPEPGTTIIALVPEG